MVVRKTGARNEAVRGKLPPLAATFTRGTIQGGQVKKSLMMLSLFAAVAMAPVAALAQGPGKAVIFKSADKLEYKQMAPKVSWAVLWGDPDKTAHGTFTKFAPGFDAGLHTHTNDVWIVVLKGAYLYKDDAGEKRVGPGSFLLVPGGKKHWSGGDAKEGALFYEESSGKFDSIPAK
jgi:quercetin dioxygenase-like cupin family protein